MHGLQPVLYLNLWALQPEAKECEPGWIHQPPLFTLPFQTYSKHTASPSAGKEIVKPNHFTAQRAGSRLRTCRFAFHLCEEQTPAER